MIGENLTSQEAREIFGDFKSRSDSISLSEIFSLMNHTRNTSNINIEDIG